MRQLLFNHGVIILLPVLALQIILVAELAALPDNLAQDLHVIRRGRLGHQHIVLVLTHLLLLGNLSLLAQQLAFDGLLVIAVCIGHCTVFVLAMSH